MNAPAADENNILYVQQKAAPSAPIPYSRARLLSRRQYVYTRGERGARERESLYRTFSYRKLHRGERETRGARILR